MIQNLIKTGVGVNCNAVHTSTYINTCVIFANTHIHQIARQNSKYKGMGTTFVAVTFEGNHVTAANVGDSRMYIINDFITQITKDHSLVEEMIDMGGIDREAARSHPDKNIITRAVGVKEYVNRFSF